MHFYVSVVSQASLNKFSKCFCLAFAFTWVSLFLHFLYSWYMLYLYITRYNITYSYSNRINQLIQIECKNKTTGYSHVNDTLNFTYSILAYKTKDSSYD